jgi:cytochrome c oxidase assembly factor CtaG
MIVADTGPYVWSPHLITWAVLVVVGGSVILGHRHLERSTDHPIPWTRREMVAFGGAWLLGAIALTWPVGTLAADWSLTALGVQRLLLVLAVAPLLLIGLPYDLVQWLTRPRWVDAVLLRLHRPPVAIPLVTILLVGSMTPVLVRAQATIPWARGLLDLGMVLAGLILWIPVIGRIPGIPRLRPVVRFGYLVAQAVVPAFLSFIYIFSNHPLYPQYAHSHAAIGLRPLNDQQIAGFVSKLSMLLVLLIVGAVVLSRAPRSEEELAGTEPLVWADVERQFERADRRGLGPVSAVGAEGADAPSGDPGTGETGTGSTDRPGGDLTDHSHRQGDSPEGDGPDPD